MSIKIENIAPLTTMEQNLAEVLTYVADKGAIEHLIQFAVEDEFGNASAMTERVTQSPITNRASLETWKEHVALNPGNEFNIAITTNMSNMLYMLMVNDNARFVMLTHIPPVGEPVDVYVFTEENDSDMMNRLGKYFLESSLKLREHVTIHLASRESILNSLPVKTVMPGGV